MAVYKVIQDVESEDKLLGPLTLKGFVYAAIAGISAFINFKLLLISSPIKWIFIPVFALPMVLFGLLASPLGRDQPTEVWLLSKIRFFLKPRSRIWDQEGMQELVTVTAPKKEEPHLTKDLSQSEVRSRLKTLASTLDTRGWAIKNVNTNLNLSTPNDSGITQPSDRLVANAGYTQSMPVIEIHPADDILDEHNNPTAQKFVQMMDAADAKRKRSVLAAMKDLIKNGGQSEPKRSGGAELDKRAAKAEISHFKEHVQKKTAQAHHKAVATKPPSNSRAKKPEPTSATRANQSVNMELAQSGSAFSVATLSKLANRQPQSEPTGPNEVTISLH